MVTMKATCPKCKTVYQINDISRIGMSKIYERRGSERLG